MVYKRTWKDPKKPKGFRVSKLWYGSYLGADGKPKRVKLLTDKRESERLLDEYRLRVEHQRMGLIPSYDEAEKRPLGEHLNDFEAHLRANQRTWKHVRLTVARVGRLLDACGFVTVADMEPEPVEAFLADLLRAGRGTVTRNCYLRSLKSFVRWMVDTGRTARNRLAGLKALNARADLKHERRALTEDETRRLLRVAANGEPVAGLSGPERCLLYRLALTTGLRVNEIRTLTWSNLDLDTPRPTVTVEAVNSKHRRRDVLPLSLDTAAALRTWRTERRVTDPFGERVFSHVPTHTARILRADLEAAGIPYCDEGERYLDFHALRVSYGSALARSGVHPRTAQGLLRHRSIDLTMNVYTKLELHDLRRGVDALPDLNPPPEAEELRATGTDGRGAGTGTVGAIDRGRSGPIEAILGQEDSEGASAENGVLTREMASVGPSGLVSPERPEPPTDSKRIRFTACSFHSLSGSLAVVKLKVSEASKLLRLTSLGADRLTRSSRQSG